MDVTVVFIVAIAIIIAVYDFYIIAKKGKHHSVSAVLIRWFRDYPVITFMFGLLCGHLLWSMRTEDIYNDVECKKVREIKEEVQK